MLLIPIVLIALVLVVRTQLFRAGIATPLRAECGRGRPQCLPGRVPHEWLDVLRQSPAAGRRLVPSDRRLRPHDLGAERYAAHKARLRGAGSTRADDHLGALRCSSSRTCAITATS